LVVVAVVLFVKVVVDVLVVAPGAGKLNLAYKSSSKEVDVEEVEFKNDELVVVGFFAVAVVVVVVVLVVGCDEAEELYEKSRRRENSRARPMSSSYGLLLEAGAATGPVLSWLIISSSKLDSFSGFDSGVMGERDSEVIGGKEPIVSFGGSREVGEVSSSSVVFFFPKRKLSLPIASVE
jgi:hypothetical protein